MVDEQEAAWEPRAPTWTRRRFLVAGAAGAAVVVAGSAGLRSLASSSSKAVGRFRSRPDLAPPVVDVLHRSSGATPGLILLAPRDAPGQSGPLIVDTAGQPVWFLPRPGKVVADLRVQEYQGLPVLTWWEGEEGDDGDGEFVVVDQSYTEVAKVRAGNGHRTRPHEMVIFGTTALISAAATVAGGRVLESVVQEIDMHTGAVRFEWRSHDHVPVAESFVAPPGNGPHDYFHLTSIDLDGRDLLISARNTHALYKVARPSGAVVWRMGGRRSDFAMAPDAGFARQHDAGIPAEGEISVFDNREPAEGSRSRGLILSVDAGRRTVSVARQLVHPRGLWAGVGGNLQALDAGRVFTGWGSQPFITEFGPNGEVLFDARLAAGWSYRAQLSTWEAAPFDTPTVTVEIEDGARATIYASWNGATAVSQWQVLAGAGPDSLAPALTAPRTGFETAIRLPNVPALVSVTALDVSGRVLSRSQQVPLAPAG